MSTHHPPRILDASAIVELFAGHPTLMRLLDDAEAGRLLVALPATAVAEAQAALRAAQAMWFHIFAFRGLHELPLTWHGAVAAGGVAAPRLEHHPMQPALIGPLMVGQVVQEAISMSGVVVTRIPEAYGAYDIAIMAI